MRAVLTQHKAADFPVGPLAAAGVHQSQLRNLWAVYSPNVSASEKQRHALRMCPLHV
jgi:hypothetical protein